MGGTFFYRLVGVLTMSELKVFEAMKTAHPDAIKGFIEELEKTCGLHAQHEPDEIKMAHYFSRNLYAREMKLKKGSLVVGKIHRFENLNILSQGEVSVLSTKGVERFKAPHTFVAPRGAKRVIFAHTDVTWTTLHSTEEQDLEKIEADVIAPSYDDVPGLNEIEQKILKGEK